MELVFHVDRRLVERHDFIFVASFVESAVIIASRGVTSIAESVAVDFSVGNEFVTVAQIIPQNVELHRRVTK